MFVFWRAFVGKVPLRQFGRPLHVFDFFLLPIHSGDLCFWRALVGKVLRRQRTGHLPRQGWAGICGMAWTTVGGPARPPGFPGGHKRH